jgi:hypothetical protein
LQGPPTSSRSWRRQVPSVTHEVNSPPPGEGGPVHPGTRERKLMSACGRHSPRLRAWGVSVSLGRRGSAPCLSGLRRFVETCRRQMPSVRCPPKRRGGGRGKKQPPRHSAYHPSRVRGWKAGAGESWPPTFWPIHVHSRMSDDCQQSRQLLPPRLRAWGQWAPW